MLELAWLQGANKIIVAFRAMPMKYPTYVAVYNCLVCLLSLKSSLSLSSLSSLSLRAGASNSLLQAEQKSLSSSREGGLQLPVISNYFRLDLLFKVQLAFRISLLSKAVPGSSTSSAVFEQEL